MRVFGLGLLLVFLGACTPTPEQSLPNTTWTPDVRDGDLLDFIKLVQQATGKIMVIDPRVRGRVNIANSQALTSEQLYNLFLATLEVNGFAAIDVDDIVRIVPAREVGDSALYKK